MKKRSEALAAELEVIRAELATLDEVEEPTDEQVARASELLGEWDEKKTAHDAAVDYETKIEAVRSAALNPRQTEPGDHRYAPNVVVKKDPYELLRSSAGLAPAELRRAVIDSNLRALEEYDVEGDNQAHFEKLVKRHASDSRWALNILARSRPEYVAGWSKLVTGQDAFLTDVERAAMAVGTNTAGGFLVPTHLDPTLIMTNNGTSNVIRSMSRVVSLTEGSVWSGVTTAGATASWDGELVEVSDDTPAFARPQITVFKAQALIQASIEAFEDISGLTSDVMMILADARDRLEGAAHATGSGSGQPVGIFTALDANTNVEIISTTAATIGEVDLHSVYRQVPIRWRGRGTWLTNPLYALAVKRLGTAVSSSYSGDLTQPVSERWLGRPVVESDDAPTTQTTTANDNEIVFGDFSNFVIVDKPGSTSIEFIPHLFNTSNNLPDGRRAWYMHFRSGSDSVNDLAFRLLQDKTSA